jgi:sialate O-acetylesterase
MRIVKGLLFAVLLLRSAIAADLRLPAIFGDHMVLQQGQPLPVWGRAPPGATVRVAVAGRRAETKAGADGRWRVKLGALPSSGKPVRLSVTCGGESKILADVLVGDVWLCSGQSNMAMGVGAMKRHKEIVANADHPKLRLFIVQRQVSFTPCEDLQGEWVVCSPKGIMLSGGWKGFSAVGYFFGRSLLASRKTPIGLVGSYVGGSGIHAWSSLESLQTFPGRRSDTWKRVDRFLRDKRNLPTLMARHAKELAAWEKEHADRNAALRKALAQWHEATKHAKANGEPAPPRPKPGKISRRPLEPTRNFGYATVLFNGMIAPLMPFGIKGAIWYQGEAEAYPQKAEAYATLLPMMIADWRKRWGQGDFPFLIVQLPNLENRKDTWPIVRESQRRAVARTTATGMAVTIDVGDPDDLHPAFKQAIGERLALVARNVAYGEEIVSSGPMITSATRRGRHIVLSFSHVGNGLMAGALKEGFRASPTGRPLTGFEVAGASGAFVPARATIDGDTVVLTPPDGKTGVKTVRYAWAANPAPTANLYNRDGLPASPFTIAVKPPVR